MDGDDDCLHESDSPSRITKLQDVDGNAGRIIPSVSLPSGAAHMFTERLLFSRLSQSVSRHAGLFAAAHTQPPLSLPSPVAIAGP